MEEFIDKFMIPSKSIPHIIGKRGVNINNIKKESQTNCFVVNDKKNSHVVIKGTQSAIEHAKRLIRNIVNNSIMVYEHPQKIILAINTEIDPQQSYSIHFIPINLNRSINTINKNVYSISLEKSDDPLSNSFETMSLRTEGKYLIKEHGTYLFQCHSKEIMNNFVNEIILAKSGLESSDNVSSRLKIIASFGKNTFYSSRKNKISEKTIVSLEKFIQYRVGVNNDIKVTFNNAVDSNEMKNKLQWTRLDDKKHISIHLVDTLGKKRYVISLIEKDGILVIRKFRILQIKYYFFNIVNIHSQYDIRLRLNRTDSAFPTNEIIEYVNQLSLDSVTQNIIVPSNSRFNIDIIRYKNKERYSNDLIKMSLNKIISASNSTNEILFNHSKLNEALKFEFTKDEMKNYLTELIETSQKFINN